MFQLVPFAANSKDECLRSIRQFIIQLKEEDGENFEELCKVLRNTVDQDAYFRYATSATNKGECIETLEKVTTDDIFESAHLSSENVAFFFGPQGPQHANMLEDCLGVAHEFSCTVDRMLQYASKAHGVDYSNLTYPSNRSPEADNVLQTGEYASTTMLIIEHSIAAQLKAWGIDACMLGTWSNGELGAALHSGAIDEEAAVDFYSKRGKIFVKAPPASLVAIEEKYPKPEGCYVQTYFSDDFVTILGPPDEIEQYREELSEHNIPFFSRQTPHGFHSPMVNCIVDDYRTLLETIHFRPCSPNYEVLSCLDAQRIQQYNTEYWINQITNTVRVGDVFRKIEANENIQAVVVIGPLPIFERLLRQSHVNLPVVLTCPSRSESIRGGLYVAAAQLWTRGYNLDWDKLYPEVAPDID